MLNTFCLAGLIATQAPQPVPLETPELVIRRPVAPSIPLTVAYFGETVTHPGGMLGTERAVWRSGWQEAIAMANLGGYRHYGNHTGLFADAELGYRLTIPSGTSLELNGGVGYLHTILDGTVYAPSASGQLEVLQDWGRPALMPSFALGLGQEVGEAARLFARLQLFGQYPYNLTTLPHVAIQVGLTWGLR